MSIVTPGFEHLDGTALDAYRAATWRAVASVPRARWSEVVLVLRPDEEPCVMPRAELAADLRRAGLYRLASSVLVMVVRPGRILMFLDGEGETSLAPVVPPPFAELVDAPAAPSCFLPRGCP